MTVKITGRHELSSPHHHRHRDVQSGGPRAAVFGASDGLLTNVSLILGVAGAHPHGSVVRLAGIAGLLAGAFSMGAGEYISVTAQKELIDRELDVERQALRDHPEEERRELVASYVARGVQRDVAEQVATAIMADPELALEAHSREELGVDPSETGNPRVVAGSSFVSFAIGAIVPLLPWFFASDDVAVLWSIVLGGLGSITIGVVLAQFTGRSKVVGGLRQLAITAAAAAITYGIGAVLGVRTA
jgi:VIT1/CCC1 family predicted Fe2+/Mn2+ transporter